MPGITFHLNEQQEAKLHNLAQKSLDTGKPGFSVDFTNLSIDWLGIKVNGMSAVITFYFPQEKDDGSTVRVTQ